RRSDRPQLEEGMTLCRSTLNRYQVLDNPGWWESPAVRYLPEKDQEQLHEEVGELLFLLAKATHLHAVHHTASSNRDEQIRAALRFNTLAESCYGKDRAPRAVWQQHSDLVKLLGNQLEAQELAKKAEQVPLRVDKDYYLIGHKHAIQGNLRQALDLLQKATQ